MKRESMARFLFDLKRWGGIIEAFDDELWYSTVDIVTMDSAGNFTFLFKNSMKINVNMIGDQWIKI